MQTEPCDFLYSNTNKKLTHIRLFDGHVCHCCTLAMFVTVVPFCFVISVVVAVFCCCCLFVCSAVLPSHPACFFFHSALHPHIRLIRDRPMEVGEEEDYNYTYRYTHYQNYSCIKMGSDESHFKVSLIVRDKITRQCPQTIRTFLNIYI